MKMKIFIRNLLTKKLNLKSEGFSLIEILIALTLLSIAGSFVAGKIFEQLEEGKASSAKIQMGNFANALKDYRRKCNFYPTTEQGLDALVEKPSGRECKNYPPTGFLEEDIPLDPWDSDYIYSSDGKTFNIISAGTDGEEGTEDDVSFRDKKE